jgi:ABC-type bacteriocin/lantibiotic exporter with double-glycine peptidase domain
LKTLKKIIDLLTPQELKRGILLLSMVTFAALLEMLGVASILPFMAVLADPNIVETNFMISKFFQFSSIFGIENKQQFVFFLGILVFIFLVISTAIKALTAYLQTLFSSMIQYSIAKRVVESYLKQTYSWFLNRHSADLAKTILSEVSTVAGKGINPMLALFVQSIIVFTILILLILVNPKISLITGFTFGLAYGLIYMFTRVFLKHIGQERLKSNKLRFKAVNEAFSAIKEIKVSGLEQVYIDRFSDPAKSLAKHQASGSVISQTPRYALEVIAFGGILLITLYLMIKNNNFATTVPVIALYVFAGYRLMPALQGIFISIVSLRFVGPSLDALHEDLMNLQSSSIKKGKDILLFKKDISLKHIYYKYPNASRTALKDIHLTIPARSTVGIVGATGSGKTTIVDIILGLLEAKQGTLEVDSKIIDKNNRRAWQHSIGYVPQQIYLTDDTVAANIAFGIDIKHIDQKAVERAAKIANIHDFVSNELSMGYQTTVGERGARLSGGQRQRIAIARALYNEPNVLILDEATNALDNLTEQAVMEAIENLRNKITIILITHRLSTVKKCDNIFLIDKGELKQEGTFEYLKNISGMFRETTKNL